MFIYQNKTCVQTLEGHTNNVTCVRFHPELPIILTGSEDGGLRVFMTATQTNPSPKLSTASRFSLTFLLIPLGTVRVWHCNTYRLENTLNYGMDRVWCICGQPGSNVVALGFDDGSIIIKVYCVIAFCCLSPPVSYIAF